MKIVLLLIISILMVSNLVFADCEYNGRMYPPGTTINGKTCQTDGSWR